MTNPIEPNQKSSRSTLALGVSSQLLSRLHPQLLSIEQTATLLNMSTRWVGRCLSDGRLTRIKLGRSTRIRLSEVEQILREGIKT